MRFSLLFFNITYVAMVVVLCWQGSTSATCYLDIEDDSMEQKKKAAYCLIFLSGVVGMVEGIRNSISLVCNETDDEEKLKGLLKRSFVMACIVFSCHLVVVLLPPPRDVPEFINFGFPYISWNAFAMVFFFIMLL